MTTLDNQPVLKAGPDSKAAHESWQDHGTLPEQYMNIYGVTVHSDVLQGPVQATLRLRVTRLNYNGVEVELGGWENHMLNFAYEEMRDKAQEHLCWETPHKKLSGYLHLTVGGCHCTPLIKAQGHKAFTPKQSTAPSAESGPTDMQDLGWAVKQELALTWNLSAPASAQKLPPEN